LIGLSENIIQIVYLLLLKVLNDALENKCKFFLFLLLICHLLVDVCIF
jgi:hypothetical protein